MCELIRKLMHFLSTGLLSSVLVACGGSGGSPAPGSDPSGGDSETALPTLSFDTAFGGSGAGWLLIQPSNDPSTTLSNLTRFEVNDAIRDPASGKFLVTGRIYDEDSGLYRMAVWRLNTDGSLDNTFGMDFDGDSAKDGFYIGPTVTVNWGNAISLDSSGNILVAGGYGDGFDLKAAVWRLNPDGTEDASFEDFATGSQPVLLNDPDSDADGNPEGTAEAYAVKALPDGRIAVVGNGEDADYDNSMVIWVIAENSFLGATGWIVDTSFFGDGAYEYRFPGADRGATGFAVEVDSTGRIFAAGSAESEASGGLNLDVAIWCVKADSTRCDNFTGTGSGEDYFLHNLAGGDGADEAYALKLDTATGDLYVAGRSDAGALRGDDAFVLKLAKTGAETWSLDTSFGGDRDGNGVADGILAFGSTQAMPEAGWALDLDPAAGKIALAGERGIMPLDPVLWIVSSSGALESETLFAPSGLSPDNLGGIINSYRGVAFAAGGSKVTALGVFFPLGASSGVFAAQYTLP